MTARDIAELKSIADRLSVELGVGAKEFVIDRNSLLRLRDLLDLMVKAGRSDCKGCERLREQMDKQEAVFGTQIDLLKEQLEEMHYLPVLSF